MASVKQAAQKAATGPYAAALNNNSEAEQRARDVASRRQSDNAAYTAYVMGQQGKLAAAGMAADQHAAQQTAGVQAATLQGNAGLGRGLQAARAAQGIAGTVPSQQVAGLADDAARQNLILGAATQRSVDRSGTNAGKAGFVQAAALANMNAHSRAIAGDEFDQTSRIRQERTGLLADEANATMQQRAAEAQAAADVRQAELAAQSRDADRASREDIAGAQLDARQREGESDRAFRARQNSLDRQAKRAAAGSADTGTPDRADAMKFRATVSTAAADAKHALASDGVWILGKDGKKTGERRKPTEAEVRSELRKKYKDADIANSALDLAILGHISPTNESRLRANHGIRTPRAWKPRTAARSALGRIATAPNSLSPHMPRG